MINKFISKKLFVSLFLFSFLILQAQTASIPLLERKITLTIINQPAQKILNQISEQVGCFFSYSPELINTHKVSTIVVANKPLKIVLNEVFDDKVELKTRGRYIILTKKVNPKSNVTNMIEGYIYDKQTGNQLINASVYNKQLGLSAISNKYGYFQLEVPKNQQTPQIFISKVGYSDTLLFPSTQNLLSKLMEVNLKTRDKKPESGNNFTKFLPKWLLPRKIDIHSTNLTDSIFRKVQFSLLPMVNTNALLTGNTKNDFSVNLTVGYVYAIQKGELGAGLNIVRTNAGVCQLAGVGNIVGTNSYGLQAAGGFNVAQITHGIQSTGGINVARDKANIQTAGGVNISGKANAQAAGGVNFAKETAKLQIAGGINIVGNKANIQTAGALNIAKQVNFQASGAINLARDTANLQITGGVNITHKTSVQISAGANLAHDATLLQLTSGLNYAAKTSNIQIGVVNITKQLKTFQLGIVNIADSCTGIPFGLFSFVRTGYHRLELSVDETSFVNIAFRSGVQQFHTCFSAGILTKNLNKELFNYGFGVGTSIGNQTKCLFDIDVSINQFANSSKFLTDGRQFKLYGGIDRKLSKHTSLAVGISYNVLTSKTTSTEDQLLYSQIAPYTISNQLFNNNANLSSWIGGKVAFRFM